MSTPKKPATPQVNPLLSQNIPPPPPVYAAPPTPAKADNGITVSEYQATRAPEQKSIRPSEDKRITTPAAAKEDDEERATIELSLYLRPAQDDKLEDLRRAYKRATKKKISANEVIRRLIDRAELESLL